MVGSKDTCDEAIECIVALYVVILDVYQTYLVGDVCVQGRTLLDSNNVTVRSLLCCVDSIDENLGLAGTSSACDEFNRNSDLQFLFKIKELNVTLINA